MKIFKRQNREWDFETYTKPKTRFIKGDSALTVYKNGVIILNSKFICEANEELKKAEYAKLFYDKNTNSMGLKFVNSPNETGTSKLTSDKFPNRHFSARAFINYYGLNLETIQGKYKPTKEFINDAIGYLWVIQLKKKEAV